MLPCVLTDDQETWGIKLQPGRMTTKPGSALARAGWMAGARFQSASRIHAVPSEGERTEKEGPLTRQLRSGGGRGHEMERRGARNEGRGSARSQRGLDHPWHCMQVVADRIQSMTGPADCMRGCVAQRRKRLAHRRARSGSPSHHGRGVVPSGRVCSAAWRHAPLQSSSRLDRGCFPWLPSDCVEPGCPRGISGHCVRSGRERGKEGARVVRACRHRGLSCRG